MKPSSLYNVRKLKRRLQALASRFTNPFEPTETCFPVSARDMKEALIIADELGSLLMCIDYAHRENKYKTLCPKLQSVRFILTHIYQEEYHYGSYQEGVDIEEVHLYKAVSVSMQDRLVRDKLVAELPSKWQDILSDLEELKVAEPELSQLFAPYLPQISIVVSHL